MTVTIHVKMKRTTDKAILVEYEGEDIWLPKSQISTTVYGPVGTDQDISISDWIADQKNITISDDERYIVEQNPAGISWGVKDTSTNPVHIMCSCGSRRDAEIIAASLEMTKNKL